MSEIVDSISQLDELRTEEQLGQKTAILATASPARAWNVMDVVAMFAGHSDANTASTPSKSNLSHIRLQRLSEEGKVTVAFAEEHQHCSGPTRAGEQETPQGNIYTQNTPTSCPDWEWLLPGDCEPLADEQPRRARRESHDMLLLRHLHQYQHPLW